MVSERRLVWIDLEMTGLTDTDTIIEIATVVTDTSLMIVAEGPNCVVHQPDLALEAMGPWCQRQHAQSGLIQLVKDSVMNEMDAQALTLDFLRQHVQANTAPLCGNSICTDRRFIRRCMPELDQFLHYRQLDVTSIKLLARYWTHGICEYESKHGHHRALSDVYESIEELKYYRQFMFQNVDAISAE